MAARYESRAQTHTRLLQSPKKKILAPEDEFPRRKTERKAFFTGTDFHPTQKHAIQTVRYLKPESVTKSMKRDLMGLIVERLERGKHDLMGLIVERLERGSVGTGAATGEVYWNKTTMGTIRMCLL